MIDVLIARIYVHCDPHNDINNLILVMIKMGCKIVIDGN